MRLGVSRCFDFDFGRHAAKLPLELIPCLLKFPEALAKTARELGKFARPKEQQDDDKDKNGLWPAGHAQGKRKVHSGTIQSVSQLAIRTMSDA